MANPAGAPRQSDGRHTAYSWAWTSGLSTSFFFNVENFVVAGVSPWFLDQEISMKFPNRLVVHINND